jgi:iron complex transport system substrate-binding protein
MDERDPLTGQIVDSAYKLHVALGPGLAESVYEIVLARDLERRGMRVERQKYLSFEFDGLQFSDCFRVDLLVDDKVIVEIKSAESLAPLHAKQLLTYLRLSRLPVGLLLNFGAAKMKDGIRRIANGLAPTAASS